MFVVSLCITTLAAISDISSWIVGHQLDTRIPYFKYDELQVGSPLSFSANGMVTCDPDNTFERARILFKNSKTKLIANGFNTTPCIEDPYGEYCINSYKSIRNAVYECDLEGMQFDYEWNGGILGTCNINQKQVKHFTIMMDMIQRSVGGNFTVSADVGNCIFQVTPWVNADIFKMNPNLLMNTMSYHTPFSCSIKPWIHDAWVFTNIWKVNPQQIRWVNTIQMSRDK